MNEGHDYLWDGSGEPDSEVQRLEQLLGTLRHDGAPPQFPAHDARTAGQARRLVVAAMGVAAVLVCGVGIWIAARAERSGWNVERLQGQPAVDGDTIAQGGRLHVGDWLVTDSSSKARMEVADVGEVEVEPGTRLRLVRAGTGEHRLSLVRGTIHARIWAAPGLFFVDTPSSVAVDLGCAYTLQVDESGAGMVRVTLGWVGFEFRNRESFIPEGAVCATRPGIGPGTPRYEDAPEGYADALAVLDFAPRSDPRREQALELVLEKARRRDAFTLWHLLTRVEGRERVRVYDRMAALAPPPSGVAREAVLSGDRASIDRWWDSLGLEDTTWWRLLRQRW